MPVIVGQPHLADEAVKIKKTLGRHDMRIRSFAQAALTVALSFAGYSAYGAEEPYKIGMLSSFSGYVANMGLGGRDGLMLAVDEINKGGGVNGRTIKIIPLNDESDATKGVPLAVN